MKHENDLLSNKLAKVKFPPWRDNEADVHSVWAFVSANYEGLIAQTSALLSLYRWKSHPYQLVWCHIRVGWWRWPCGLVNTGGEVSGFVNVSGFIKFWNHSWIHFGVSASWVYLGTRSKAIKKDLGRTYAIGIRGITRLHEKFRIQSIFGRKVPTLDSGIITFQIHDLSGNALHRIHFFFFWEMVNAHSHHQTFMTNTPKAGFYAHAISGARLWWPENHFFQISSN